MLIIQQLEITTYCESSENHFEWIGLKENHHHNFFLEMNVTVNLFHLFIHFLIMKKITFTGNESSLYEAH